MSKYDHTHDGEMPVSTESFADLLNEVLPLNTIEGTVLKGKVIAIRNDFLIVDVNLKSEGRIPLREFGSTEHPAVGETLDVFFDRFEGANGEIVLSYEKACRERVWTDLEKAHTAQERVTGTIFGRVKGGFTVDLSGAIAFLPTSQLDVRPIRDFNVLFNKAQPFMILKMDKKRGNIVVSRKAVLEESRADAKQEFVSTLQPGQVLPGIIKNITDYGAFVDLGGVDGLLHVTDISWRRINHPSDVLQVGQNVQVQVIRYNAETQRISLGMKQLESDPWQNIEGRFQVGQKLKGRVTNITDYGAFIELESGIEGLAHVSEMSWTKKNVHPGKIISTSQEVEVMVLDVEPGKRRISLGLKQCILNPWLEFKQNHNVGDAIEGEIKNTTEFGLFVGLSGDIDGMVHLNDLDWSKPGEKALQDYKKGQMVHVKVLDIDVEKERISLGIKQLADDPFEKSLSGVAKGDVVTCTIIAVSDAGLEVNFGENAKGFIRKADLAKERTDQRADRFAVGEKVDAKVVALDKSSRKVALSVKALEVQEEKEAMAKYGSSDSGARLGDILGAAFEQQKEDKK
jgi:small subunit ribosomal protein S1